jgi:hypothetical protein
VLNAPFKCKSESRSLAAVSERRAGFPSCLTARGMTWPRRPQAIAMSLSEMRSHIAEAGKDKKFPRSAFDFGFFEFPGV